MRYFLRLAYNGTAYHGWQRQPHSISVQEVIEQTLSTICNQPTAIVGCGRTDTGVHASDYVAHFELEREVPQHLVGRLNRMLPADIVIQTVQEVGRSTNRPEDLMHARFDASRRAYRYDISAVKDPFRQGQVWHYHAFKKLDLSLMNTAAAVLLEYEEFAPFCKSKHDAKTMRCALYESRWVSSNQGQELHFYIAANRFLRGMVRLIVGACIQVGLGELSLAALHDSLKTQQRLPRPVSVPPDGLYLTEVSY